MRTYFMVQGRIWLIPIFYLQFIALAELLTTLREPRVGLILHGIVMLAMLIHGGMEKDVRNRRFLLSLALAPLIRLLSLSLPLSGRPLVDWYLWVGALLFVATYFTARIIGLSGRRLGITLKNLPLQIMFGLTGIGLGFIEFLILKPEPIIEEFTFEALIFPALILAFFTGVLEEAIFRGIIQEASLTSYGKFGITFGAVLFAVLHVGYGSWWDVFFVFSVAMLFGIFVLKTGSLVGVFISHSLTNIFLLLIFPFTLGSFVEQQSFIPPTPTPIIQEETQNVAVITPLFTTAPTEIQVTGSPEEATVGITELTSTITSSPPTETPKSTTEPSDNSSACKPPPDWIEYTVQAEDTLFSLGRKFGVSVSKLQEANCMGVSTLLKAGEKIYVPDKPTITPNSP